MPMTEQAARETGLGGLAVSFVAIAAAALVLGAATRRSAAVAAPRGRTPPPPAPCSGLPRQDEVEAARRLNRAAGVLAVSVLADSAVEHYRGTFHNPAMYGPLVSSVLSLVASAHGHTDRRQGAHWARDLVYAAAGLTGLGGTGFHLHNITKRPGGFSWLNLFYAAPLGAPAALALSGLMGFLAERVRDTPPGRSPYMLGLPAGRVVGVAASVGLLGTVGEAGLMHFRGAFQDPFMVLPVTVPPDAALLLGAAAIGRSHTNRVATRWSLRAAATIGVAGVAFHAYGVSRNMGGWRNWSQNVPSGPPLPAPPSFTGLALAGLAALGLLEDHPDD
jgi:hypothetical protein